MPTTNSPGRWSHALAAIAQQSAARVVCAAWLVLTSAAALDAQSSRSAPATSVALQRCMDTAASAAPARLDAEHVIYVEQETVVAQRDDRVLVAGNPVFVWRDRGDRYDLLGLDSLFGMIIEPSLAVRAIPKPMTGRSFDGMRAAALPDGWWLVAFAEVIPAQPPKTPTVVAMWTGETDGTRWRSLQKLPMIADSIETSGMSALAWREGRARLAVPFKHAGRRLVVLYALDDGRWTARIEDLGLLSYVALALAPSRDLMAVVRPLETVSEDNNSLFLYTKSPTDSIWTNAHHIVRGGDAPVRDPLFSGEKPRVLSWRRARATSGPGEAWFATLDEVGDSVSTPVRLGTGDTESNLASRADRAVLAITNRVWPNPTLQLFELGGHSVAAHTMTTAYRGLLGLAVTHANVLLIAARAASSPRDPSVVSILQTHAWRCQ
jgi:hypothetical protein